MHFFPLLLVLFFEVKDSQLAEVLQGHFISFFFFVVILGFHAETVDFIWFCFVEEEVIFLRYTDLITFLFIILQIPLRLKLNIIFPFRRLEKGDFLIIILIRLVAKDVLGAKDQLGVFKVGS